MTVTVESLTAYSGIEAPSVSLPVLVDNKRVEVILLQKLRAFPGRRAVFKAQLGDKLVLVKLFTGEHCARDSQKEIQGIQALQFAKCSTPLLLATVKPIDIEADVLIFEYIENATNLTSILATQPHRSFALDAIKKIVEVVASHHQAGIQQVDIHLDNFLISHNLIYTIDGGAINRTYLGKILPNNEILHNLALFFAQLNPSYDMYMDEFLSVYNVKRNLVFEVDDVIAAVKHLRNKRLTHFLSKIYRNCSQFSCTKYWNEFRVCSRSWATTIAQKWLDNIDDHIHTCIDSDQIKKGNTTTVLRMMCGNHPVIVKRYNIKGFWHALNRCWRPSRAWVAWRNAHMLLFFGISTPQPQALIEKRIGFLRRSAYLVTDAIEGVSLDQIKNTYNAEWVSAVCDIFKQMCAANVSHGDLKATNFMMKGNQAYLIDLDTMKQHHSAWLFKRVFAKDVERFMRNWQSTPDIEVAFKAELKKIM